MHQDDYLPDTAFASADWRKASVSAPESNCVEFAAVGDVIGIRDSKVPGGPILQFNRDEIRAMLDGAKKGEFDNLA